VENSQNSRIFTTSYLFLLKISSLKKVLLTIFSFWLHSAGFAQGGTAKVSSFSAEKYQASRQNWDMAFDHNHNLLYVANSKGLLQYDGQNWQLYPFYKIIRSVYVAPNGIVYTGAQGEFGYWKSNQRGFLEYTSLKKQIPLQSFDNEAIWNIIETKNGILLQSFAYAFLYQKNGKIVQIKLPGNINFASQIGAELLVPAIFSGIYQIKNKDTYSLLHGTEQAFAKDNISGLLQDPVSKSLIICTSKGIFKQINSHYVPLSLPLNKQLQNYQINKAVLLANNTIAIGTIVNGVMVVDLQGRLLYSFNKNNGLADNTVLTMQQDSENNLWIGTDNGISRIDLNISSNYLRDASGELGVVYDVAKQGNTLYVGTNHGVFSYRNGRYNLIAGSQGQVWSLDNINGQIYAGHNAGTFVLQQNSLKKICNSAGGWQIISLKNSDNYYLQATYSQLVIYQKQKNNLLKPIHWIGGIAAQQLAQDSSNVVWLKTSNNQVSKVKFDPDFQKITWKKDYFFHDNLATYLNIFVQNGQLHVCQSGRQYLYNSKLGVFEKINQKQAIKKVFVLKNGAQVTLSQNNRLVYKTVKYEKDIAENNLVEDYENIKQIDSLMFFCLNDGLAYTKLADMLKQLKNHQAKACIRYFRFENNPSLNIDLNSKPQSNIKIPYVANSFQVVFAPGSFHKQLYYSYMVENYTTGWSVYQASNTKTFYNMPAGIYKILLKTNQNNHISTVTFEILAPWYWNIWAKLCYALCLVLVFNGIYRINERNLAKQQMRLEEEHKKEVERQQQEIILLKNKQLEAELIQKAEELANSTMTLIKKNELLNVIKEKTKAEASPSPQKAIISLIDKNISTSHDWKVFEKNFNQVHETFLKKLSNQYPQLSHGDLRLAAYLRMNLSTKEIANLSNITQRSVELKRYRLRKKLNLDTHADLNEFMMKQ
jgi:DNA-binding CsgD family transcriptional regulator